MAVGLVPDQLAIPAATVVHYRPMPVAVAVRQARTVTALQDRTEAPVQAARAVLEIMALAAAVVLAARPGQPDLAVLAPNQQPI
jgi:uncharacterized membrane protein YczE